MTRIQELAGAALALSLSCALGCEQKIAEKLELDAYAKVTADAVAQYGIAKRSGDKMQTCAQAGLVSAAYLQAKDEPKFNEWKATEKADCAAAGMPR
jgi:hypothetical protein